MTKIARIVKSNSHVDYVARVVDELDADEPPGPEDYGFAQFVSVPLAESAEAVGVVYDTQLVNPDYASFGPRLSSHAELKVLSPDFLHEQGVLLGLLIVGWRERDGRASAGASERGGTESVGARAVAPQSSASGARRSSALIFALGLLILCVQLLLWWILYKVPEWSRRAPF